MSTHLQATCGVAAAVWPLLVHRLGTSTQQHRMLLHFTLYGCALQLHLHVKHHVRSWAREASV